VRLTTEMLLAATSLSRAEMQANEDLLRAQFAVSIYRLETTLEAMRTKATAQLAEIGRKAAEISRLKTELARKASLILAYEARQKARKSIARRVVSLLLLLFRSPRCRARLLSGAPGKLPSVDAPPLQTIANEVGSHQAEPLPDLTGRQLVLPEVIGELPSCPGDVDAHSFSQRDMLPSQEAALRGAHRS
jgi:hypothetical protein